MARIFLCGYAVRVHDSQAYSKMDLTSERISRVSELREILWHNGNITIGMLIEIAHKEEEEDEGNKQFAHYCVSELVQCCHVTAAIAS